MHKGNHPVILYDGVCALCNGAVRWILEQDRQGQFRFAPLQGEYARWELGSRRLDANAMATVYLVVNGKLYSRSRAALEIGWRLGGVWKLAAAVAWVVPGFVRDWAYDWVARNRYEVYGKYESCPVPPPEWRGRFLD